MGLLWRVSHHIVAEKPPALPTTLATDYDDSVEGHA